MKPTLTIESILGTRGRTAVLRVLHAVSVPMNAAQVARAAGLTRAGASAVLSDLESIGLVGGNQVGWARVFWLIRDNVYVDRIVAPAFRAEAGMADELQAHLRRTFGDLCVAVLVFGSYARDEQTPDSDVDIVLVAADQAAAKRVDEVLVDEMVTFRSRWGASLSALVYDLDQAARLRETSPALYAEIEHDGVVVSGLPPFQWRRDAEA